MSWFPLEIFPYGSLSASVITTVWIGVCVVAIFNLRFGWVLSGLVVPGYLVPLLLIRPVTAGVIILESIVTYAVVYWFSERMSAKTGLWCSMFGRDRFFLLVVASIAVRLLFDSTILPWLGAYLVDELGIGFDYRNSLRSFGLVIISLMANQYWKTGLARGLFVLLVTVGITYVIVRYGLLEFTNFSVGNLRFMYEDIAGSVLASPKAYIIMLTAAVIASRMNLLYGWDFNGILLPSLIALQWYQPGKVLTSFVEAFIIMYVGRYLLGTRFFSRINMEGARLLLLFFNIGFAWKLLLGFTLPLLIPGFKVTDAYGFGYLLSTLLALKMHEKNIPARVTRATVQTSLTAVLAASAIGFLLTLLPQPWSATLNASVENINAESVTRPADLYERIHADRLTLFQSRSLEKIVQPLPQESSAFTEGLRSLKNYMQHRNSAELRSAQIALSHANYRLELMEGRYAYLIENIPVRGWGLFVLDLDNPDGLVIEVPRALDERHVIGSSIVLFRDMNAGALSLAGARYTGNADGTSDTLINRELPFHLFHRMFGRSNSLHVRGLTGRLERRISAALNESVKPTSSALDDTLWVKGAIPKGLNLVQLKSDANQLNVRWQSPSYPNVQRDESSSSFAELLLSRDTRRRIAASALVDVDTVAIEEGTLRIDGYLREWLLQNRDQIAEKATNLYVPPTSDQLLYFDEEVLTPTVQALNSSAPETGTVDDGEIRSIDQAARALGYKVVQYRHRESGESFVILQEVESDNRKYWGTFVFRAGRRKPYGIQVPRPLHEINSFEYAVTLFHRLEASSLIIAGANPDANVDGSSDLVRLDNRENIVSLVNQVLLREEKNRPYLVIHSRAFGKRDDVDSPEADVVASFSEGSPTDTTMSPLTRHLLETLDEDGLSVAYSGSSASTAGYDTGGLAQSRYLDATRNKEFVALWLSPEARSSFRQQNENRRISNRLRALGIPTRDGNVLSEVAHLRPVSVDEVPDQIDHLILRYIESDDVIVLRKLQRAWPGLKLRQTVDRDSRQAFLIGTLDDSTLAFVANLAPRGETRIALTTGKDVERFVNTRSALLFPGTRPLSEPMLSDEAENDQ